MNLQSLIEKAGQSSFRLWVLNRILLRAIPFNSPHRIWVSSVGTGRIVARLPFIRRNKNHIGGMHACALATISEYVSGLCLASVLSSDKYRFILKELSMEYHYQGKSECTVDFNITQEQFQRLVFDPLKESEKVDVEVNVKVLDVQSNHISTATILWQVKEWKSVRTK